MPLPRAADVTRAMCAIVTRGAEVGVRAAREAARVLGREGEDRLGFSPNGDFDGERKALTLEVMSLRHFCFTSHSIRSIARRMMSNALRRSPVWEATFLEQNWMAVG